MASTAGASLVARVRRTLEERRLLGSRRSVLLAVSGGPDSIAMLDVFARLAGELALTLAVASVDHGLRPEASDEVAFVGRVAAEAGLRFRPIVLGLSVGTTHAIARDARYAALHEVSRELGLERIAVGHTLDDQAETVLARILRGSGLRGLRGVHDRREDGVIRPLLDATRRDVRAHLEHFGRSFVEDPSNCDRAYLRVRVRHELLPRLAGESPEIAAHLAALADEAAEFAEFVDETSRTFVDRGESALSTVELDRLPKPAKVAAIAEFVRFHAGKSPGRRVIEAILAALESGGSVWIGGDFALEGGPGRLELRRRTTRPQRSSDLERPKD